MIKKWKFLLLFLSILILSACTATVVNYGSCSRVNLYQRVAVIPFSNHTEIPLAGERAMSITAALLESRGICNMVVYQNEHHGKILFPGMNKVESEERLMNWARNSGARYVLTGSVNEWAYKVGLDGEPVVGVSLQIIDLETGHIVWTAVGSESGGSRVAVTTVGQRLINQLLNGLFCKGYRLSCPGK